MCWWFKSTYLTFYKIKMSYFQLFVNFIIFLFAVLGILLTRLNVLILLMCLELILLSANLNFLILSFISEDVQGLLMSLFILTVAAAESAIGLALLILYYRLTNTIFFNSKTILRN